MYVCRCTELLYIYVYVYTYIYRYIYIYIYIIKICVYVCRYTELKESSLLFKLLGENDNHKEPDYGENEFEDRALQRRRKVCFNIL